MKKISLLLISFLCSLYCMAQLEVSPTFDSEKKIIYFLFKNTTQKTILISQGNSLSGHTSYFEAIFLDGSNKEIARMESAYSWDKVFMIGPNERKKTQLNLGRYGYQGVKKIRIEYKIIYYRDIEEKSESLRISNSVVFEWGS